MHTIGQRVQCCNKRVEQSCCISRRPPGVLSINDLLLFVEVVCNTTERSCT